MDAAESPSKTPAEQDVSFASASTTANDNIIADGATGATANDNPISNGATDATQQTQKQEEDVLVGVPPGVIIPPPDVRGKF